MQINERIKELITIFLKINVIENFNAGNNYAQAVVREHKCSETERF